MGWHEVRGERWNGAGVDSALMLLSIVRGQLKKENMNKKKKNMANKMTTATKDRKRRV